MKDSGIEWIGEIPEGWEVAPIRSCFDEVRTKNTNGQEQNALQFKFGNIISKTNFNANADDYVADAITNYTVVLPDTVMINGLNLNYDFKSLRVALVKEKGVITSAYAFILLLKNQRGFINAVKSTFLSTPPFIANGSKLKVGGIFYFPTTITFYRKINTISHRILCLCLKVMTI